MDILQKDREVERFASPAADRDVATTLGEDTEFSGTLKFGRTLKIAGKFEGDITSEGRLIVGKSSQVKAEIQVGSCTVEGKVTGNIIARDLIELVGNAEVQGDITASKLRIEDNVTFVGKCQVTQTPQAARPAAPAAPAATRPIATPAPPSPPPGEKKTASA